MRGDSSPSFWPRRGRGISVGRGESDFSREDEHLESARGYKTITFHEDDDFYKAYINRGKHETSRKNFELAT